MVCALQSSLQQELRGGSSGGGGRLSLYSALRPPLPFEDSPLFGLLTYFRGGCLSFLKLYSRRIVKAKPEQVFARKRPSPLVSSTQLQVAFPFI